MASAILAGWHLQAQRLVSPNQDERPHGIEPRLLVIHSISIPAGQFGGPQITDLFLNKTTTPALAQLRVSAHFLIRRDGELLQFVSCQHRAWHAGKSVWDGHSACNDYSIGIELEGTDTIPYTDIQYQTLGALSDDVCACYPVTAIVGHCHIAPGRKTDPGSAFDWQRFFNLVGSHLDGRSRGNTIA